MIRKTDAELLAEARALDEAYARADAFDKAHAPTRTVYKVAWDNGAEACGTFEEIYETEAEAEAAARDITANMIAEGIWDEDGIAEAVEVEVPVEVETEADEMAELRKAALDHQGRP